MNTPEYDRHKYYRIMNRTQSNYANQLKRISKDAKRSNFIIIYYSIALIIYSLSVIVYPNLFDPNWTTYSSIILSIIVLVYSIINGNAGYPKRIYSIQHALNEIKRLKREVGNLPDPDESTQSSGADASGTGTSVANSPAADSSAVNSPATDPPAVNSPTDLPADPNNTRSCSGIAKCNHSCGCSAYSVCKQPLLCPRFESLKEEYDELVSSTEIRDDLDFYYTIVQLCKEYDIEPHSKKTIKKYSELLSSNTEKTERDKEIEEILGYISENNPRAQRRYIRLLKLWHGLLYLTPVIIFVLGIIFKRFPVTAV